MDRYDVSQRQSPTGEILFALKDRLTQSTIEVVPEIGFHVVRMFLKGMDWLAGPPDLETLKRRSSEFGFPILSPPNRIRHALFTFEDKTYRLPANNDPHHIHGEIRNKPWKVAECGTDRDGAFITAEFRYELDDSLQAYYPHPLTYTFTYRLSEGRFSLCGTAKNEGAYNAPFGLGFHPYFSLLEEHDDDIEIIMPVISQYELDSEGFAAGVPVPNELCMKLSKGMKVSEIPADQDHLLFKMDDASAECECRILYRSKGLALAYRWGRNFPFGVLFKPGWMSGVSLEPYTCITDAFNSTLPREYTGKVHIRPNETFEFSTCVEVHRFVQA